MLVEAMIFFLGIIFGYFKQHNRRSANWKIISVVNEYLQQYNHGQIICIR